MAYERSRFLKWQDKNGNMIPDECPEDFTPRENKCIDCTPNPWATTPNWKNLDQSYAYLNEKLCTYEMPFLTREKTLMLSSDSSEQEQEEYVNSIFEHYLDDWVQNLKGNLRPDWLNREPNDPGEPRPGAIETLLAWKGKEISEQTKEKVKEAIKFKEYYLAPNPGTTVQLLYSIDYSILENLPDESVVSEEEIPEPDKSDIVVRMSAHDMVIDNIKVRKGLYMYSRYLKVYRLVESRNIIFKDSGKIFDLEDYGDYMPWDSDSHLAGCLYELDDWINNYDINIANIGWPRWFTESAVELEFRVNYKYKLKSIKVWTDRCNERPIYFGKRKIRGLKNRKSWKNPTAVNFFLKQKKIEQELSARVERPWIQVLKDYTYPEIMTTDPISEQTMPSTGNLGNTVPQCIGNALAGEFKQLGSDIMDDVFSLGDAVAYAFHKNLCRYNPGEVAADMAAVGASFGIPEDLTDDVKEGNTTMWTAAMTQAFKQIDPEDQVFAHFCLRMLSVRNGSPMQMIDDIWANGFERIKLCGLFDLLLSLLSCLMKGLSLQEALMTMLKSALKSMTAEQYGELFIGLPPEKQAEMEELVKKNLEEGKTFADLVDNATTDYTAKPGTTSTAASTKVIAGDPEKVPLFGKIKFSRPWENEEFVKQQKEMLRDDGYGNFKSGMGAGRKAATMYGAQGKQATRRTLAQKLDVAGVAKDELEPDKVMDAYIIALLEVYSDNLLILLDRLNDFPGAQIIASLMSTLDCPRPPLFNPGLADFLKSIIFPFCRGKSEITLPCFQDPRIWWPKLQDIWGLIYEILKQILLALILKILIRILVWICELIGDAICKALEVVGTTVASLPGIITGKKNLFDVIRDAICGPDTSDEEIENVVVQLVADLGVGGAALADPDRAIQFAEDLGAATTQTELISAMMGSPSTTFLRIADQIIETTYPDYREALPNDLAISKFFNNIGVLVPAEMRQEMQTALGWLGASEEKPVNPTLCATPEGLEEFKDLRCRLLEGRATPEQCEKMFGNFRGQMLNDLEQASNIMQQGLGNAVADQLPPIVSDPGCDNGIVPYENPGQINSAVSSVGAQFKQLKLAYGKDMMGDGQGWFGGGGDEWGFINMFLADTLGNPYTVHQDKTANDPDFVDAYAGWGKQDWVTDILNEEDAWYDPFGFLEPPNAGDMIGLNFSSLSAQEGAFPQYIGEWLMYQYQYAGRNSDLSEPRDLGLDRMKYDLRPSVTYDSTNDVKGPERWAISFDRLGFSGGLFTDQDVDLTDLPNMGYKVRPTPDYDKEKVWFKRSMRKRTPDIALDFYDNAKGYRFGPNGGQSAWSYGYTVKTYVGDIEEGPEGARTVTGDNTRVIVTDKINWGAEATRAASEKAFGVNQQSARAKDAEDKEEVMANRRFEFVATDDSLDSLEFDPTGDTSGNLSMRDFPNLEKTFTKLYGSTPQVAFLFDLFGGSISMGQLKGAYDNIMTAQFKHVMATIGNNRESWKYGFEFDELDLTDFDYVCPIGWKQPGDAENHAGQSFSPAKGDPIKYWEMEVANYDSDGERDGTRMVSGDDAVLGMSRNEWINRQRGTHPEKTRIFMLPPGKYGGSYPNPPMYAKPQPPRGWLGIVDIMFPENSMCSPKITDVVDFKDIEDKMSEVYPSLAEDMRLKGDPDCVVEVPFNRILNRANKAAIEGLIYCSIRIWSSVHFMKCMPLFTHFAPVFPDNYSNIFASYIVENMERSFREAGSDTWSPFKNNEFWLAYLEQCVQTYARRVDDEDIKDQDVPMDVRDALEALNTVQQYFNYPYDDDLDRAKSVGDAAWYESLKSFREEKNLEAIMKNQHHAKTIMKELVKEQLIYLGEKFVTNLKQVGIMPPVTSIPKYFLTHFTGNSNSLWLEGDVTERPIGLPSSEMTEDGIGNEVPTFLTDPLPGVSYEEESKFGDQVGWPGPFYTNGQEFTTESGEDYVGYYHGTVNEETGIDEYYVSEFINANYDQIRPMAQKVVVGFETTRMTNTPTADGRPDYEVVFNLLGDVDDWNAASGMYTGGHLSPDDVGALTSETTEVKPFYLRKYIRLTDNAGSGQFSTARAIELIKSKGSGNLSNYYPGNMRLTRDSEGNETGVTGNLGVQFGLEFGMSVGAERGVITNVEISALDVPTSAFAGIEANSKMLFCLIAKLLEDQRFLLATEYAFSLRRTLSTVAIYQDMGMMPSIGEVTAEEGDLHGNVFNNASDSMPYSYTTRDETTTIRSPSSLSGKSKPGSYVKFEFDWIEVVGDHWWWGEQTIKVPAVEGTQMAHTPGWVAEDDRNGWWASLFHMKWDEWDQVTLRKTAASLYYTFYMNYRMRKWGGNEQDDGLDNILMKGMEALKERFRVKPGMMFLPWYRKNRLRPNPFNAEGELCKRKD